MADEGPKSYKTGHTVSRHTMVMRKARDDDARRLAEAEESKRLADAVATRAIRRSARDVTRAMTRRLPDASRRVSGKTVVIHQESAISGRLPVSTRLDNRSSVRVTGGDTIIRYQSGDMVIRRGAARARLRRQLLIGYALGYLVLFGLYAWFLSTGTAGMEPSAFMRQAFSRRHGSAVVDLERAALEAMRGNRTPAEIRMAEAVSFYDGNQDLVRIEAGDRLTLLTAAKLGKAILDDERKESSKRTFVKPFLVYRETYLTNLDWPFWMTAYNALGFFLLLFLFLWRPLQNYLGTQGKKTAVALRNARDSQAEAAEYREKYKALAADIDRRGEAMRAEIGEAAGSEREAALARARRQAAGIAGGIEGALAAEAEARAGGLAVDAAREACRLARTILEKRLGRKEHDAAIDGLIADIAGMGQGRDIR